jgi:hypothetical protein
VVELDHVVGGLDDPPVVAGHHQRDAAVGGRPQDVDDGRCRLVGEGSVVDVEHDGCRHREVQPVADLHAADR